MIPATVYWMEWFLLLSTVSLACGLIFQAWRCGLDDFASVLAASLLVSAFCWTVLVLVVSGAVPMAEEGVDATAPPVCRTVVVRPMGKPLQVAQ